LLVFTLYQRPDPYTPLQKPVVVKHAQRDFATRNLDPKAKLLANGVLDLTEFGVKAMVPVIGLPWASASAASETASDALVQGDTPEGAMKKAIAAGLETYVTGKAAEGLLKNTGGFIKDAKGGKIGAAGESTGDTGYDAYLKMLDEVKKARESGMTAREYAKSKGIPSTLSDEEAAVLDKYGVKMLDDGAGDGTPGAAGESKENNKKLNWDNVISKKGETRSEHVARHSIPNFNRETHGVFNGKAEDIVNSAWENRGNIEPIDDGMGGKIYNIPYKNAGYESGYNNTGVQMDYVTVIVLDGTDDMIAAFPSFGDYTK
jgi:hypothetical protein